MTSKQTSWYTDLSKITKDALDKKNNKSKASFMKKEAAKQKANDKREKKYLESKENTEKFIKIIIDKLNSSWSILSMYIKSNANNGASCVYVNPYMAVTLYTYFKYWRAAAKNIEYTNGLFAKDPIHKNLYVFLSSDGKYLIVSWR